jgi:outer membrane protein assembly factor BamD
VLRTCLMAQLLPTVPFSLCTRLESVSGILLSWYIDMPYQKNDMWKSQKCMMWLISVTCLGMIVGCAPSLDERFAAQTDTDLFEQGKALYDQGKYKQALDYFLYVKEHFIRSQYAGPARFYAGGSHFARKDYEDAAIEYESFLLFFSNDPLAAEARFNLGVSYLEQAKGPERDQEMLQKALEEFQTLDDSLSGQDAYASKTAEYITKTRIELARHEYGVGVFYRKEKQYEASNRRLSYLIQEYPESDMLAEAWYTQGLNYVDLQQPEDAKAAFLQVIEAFPDHPLALEAQQQLEELGVSAAAPLPLSTDPPETVPESTIEGTILTVRDTTVTTDLLAADGIREGMQLRVYRQNTLVGTIRITALYDGFSSAEIESLTPGMTIQEDDRVCCPEF